jgi:4'-phosphopantetheinyl transferase
VSGTTQHNGWHEIFEPLQGRRVDIWRVRISPSAELACLYQPFLTTDEKYRAAGYRFDHLQQSFTISRGVLRILLGRYLDLPPAEIPLRCGSKGKPSLDGFGLHFNVSHSGRLAVFAFTLGCEIGVDVEQIQAIDNLSEIANRFFCREEADELLSLPLTERTNAFFLCWTRKEAYIKAIGDGLSAPLDCFRTILRPSEPARFVHVNQSPEEASRWTLHDLVTLPGYAAALAYRDVQRPLREAPVIDSERLL